MAELDAGQILLLVIGGIILTMVMLATARRVRRSRGNSPAPIREEYARLQRHGRVTRDLEEVMGELDELTRDINGRLDTRFAKLEAVIRDADERIDRLQRLLRQAQGGPALDVTVEDERIAVGESHFPAASTEHRHADIHALADQGRTAVEIAHELSRPAGEVELILSLRKVKTQTERVPAHST